MSSQPQARPRTPRSRLKQPVRIFVSSNLKEFEKIRRSLQARVERIEASGKWLLQAELTEDYPGNRLKATIDSLLAQCSIFVLLVGREKPRKWVKYELDYARTNGLPILAYEYHNKTKSPPPVQTKDFVDWLMNDGDILVRGHSPKFSDSDQLVDAVAIDLLEEVGRGMVHYARVLREAYNSQER
jgi:Thoeris protein ThsB, TIR-like domain/Domain of unknown function (DUF4062)